MILLRRWLLIWFALLVGGGQLHAASREERAYDAAVQAFHDKFYSLAASRLTQFLQNPVYHRSTNAPMALLLLAQAEYYQGNYASAASRLGDPANLARAKAAGVADRYEYWQGEAEYAQGDLEAAAHTFAALADDYPGSPLALSATVEAAAAFAADANWPQVDALLDGPNGLFQHMAEQEPASAPVATGRLLQTQSKLARQDFAAALQTLHLLNPAKLPLELKWNREYLLYQATLGIGDLDAALASTTNLLDLAQKGLKAATNRANTVPAGQGNLWATNVAESVAGRAAVLQRQGRLDEATAALRNLVFSSTAPAGQQEEAMLRLTDLALSRTNFPAAESQLEDFLQQYPDSKAADLARLTLGELHLKQFIADQTATNQLAAAQADLLAVPTNSPLAGRTWLARGWCDWLAAQSDTNTAAEKQAASFYDFSQAAARLPVSKELAVAKFKMGDAQFASGDFNGAEASYRSVLSDFAAVPEVAVSLRAPALYQLLRVRLAVTNEAGANETMGRLLTEFPATDLAQSSLLLAGEGLARFDAPAKARAVFEQFEGVYTNSPLMPQVKFAVARTYEHEANWPAAAASYEAWLRAYPGNELRPEVLYACGLALAQTGDEARAFKLFSDYPTNAVRTPLAYWWLADHFYRLGDTNLTTAEKYYQYIYQDFPTNELAFRAQLMAARAAMGRGAYRSAIRSYLDPLVSTNCPDDLKLEAKFAYCEALAHIPDTNNANLQLATNILSQIYAQYPTNEAGALAWSETGDCALQLGDLDSATNAYAQALNSPGASQELRDRVQVGWGTVLEKKAETAPDDSRPGLLAAAMQCYEAVFDPEGEVKSEFWRKKAGLQMLELNAKTGLLTGPALDGFVAKLKAIFPQLQDSTELKRLASKK
jgi:TolA-binding protein